MSSSDLPQTPVLEGFSRVVACFLLGIFSLLGTILCGVIIVVMTIRNKSKITSFNLICVAKCGGNIVALLINFCWVFPFSVAYSNPPNDTLNAMLYVVTLKIYTYNGTLAVLLAINRFVAIFYFQYYSVLFKNSTTAAIVLILCLLSVLHFFLSVFSISPSCLPIFNVSFMFVDSMITCHSGSVDEAALFSGFVLLATILLNALTLSKLIYLNFITKTTNDKRVVRNGVLFLQTLLQDALFIADIIFMTRGYKLWNHPFWHFFCFYFTGVLVHALDSVIMILFQPEIVITSPKYAKSSVVVSSKLQTTSRY